LGVRKFILIGEVDVTKVVDTHGTSKAFNRRRLRLGAKFGGPVGLAIGIGSAFHTGSIVHGALMGFVTALLGSVWYGGLELDDEARNRREGIMLSELPLRARIVLQLRVPGTEVMPPVRRAFASKAIPFKRFKVDEALRVVAVTSASKRSWGEVITAEVTPHGADECTLSLSSFPWLPTTTGDRGTNYRNVYLLRKGVMAELGDNAVLSETLLDLDRPVRAVR